MSWLVGLAGVGVTAGLGVANLSAQKSALKAQEKLQAKQTQAAYKIGVVVAAVIGVAILIKVVRG